MLDAGEVRLLASASEGVMPRCGSAEQEYANLFKGVMTTAHTGIPAHAWNPHAAERAQTAQARTPLAPSPAIYGRPKKDVGGDAAMRLSIADAIETELQRARAEIAKLKNVLGTVSRHNRQLTLEVGRARAAEAAA
jgi:hypothetical protein